MALTLFSCSGGHVVLPPPQLLLTSRQSGGNLVVHPPRPVWERSELTPEELSDWSFLVAATGRAMIDMLPQLDGGCVNYWEAGNWALNDAAEPKGRKRAQDYRSMHLHLLGRSPGSTDPAWRWGESPRFPGYAERDTYAAGFDRLTTDECVAIVKRTEESLKTRYGMREDRIVPWRACDGCGYPFTREHGSEHRACPECRRSG